MSVSRTRRGGTAQLPNDPAAIAQVPDGVTPELTALRTVMDCLVRERTENTSAEARASADAKTSVDNLTKVITVSLKAIELAWSHSEAPLSDVARELERAIDVHAFTQSPPLAAAPVEPERSVPC